MNALRLLMLATFTAFVAAGTANAAEYVSGYTKKDGTYVPGHYRSSPNMSKADNWSAKGNTNPYTGKKGTKDPYKYTPPKKK